MYSSSSVSKRIVYVNIVAVVSTQLLLICSVLSLNTTDAYLHHKCIVNQGNYQPGSEYEKNLNEIIHSTSTGDFRNGYNQSSLGKGPNSVNFLYQCRGDSYGPKCCSCYATALSELRRRCLRNKGAIIWYDQCLMEISSISSDGKVDYDNNICMSNAKNGDMHEFFPKVLGFLSKLIAKAANEKNVDDHNQPVLYATGEGRLGTKKLYGMVQCTKYLSFKGCEVCLDWITVKESDCCGTKHGVRVFSTSCSFRYEFYPLIKVTV